jgi:hypothetical protein
MLTELFEDQSILDRKLVEDAGRVADVGVRLGRIKNVQFLTALSDARKAIEQGDLSPLVIAELQKSLNTAVNDISPITLYDLRAGWQPFTEKRRGTLIFGLCCFFLLAFTAYLTQIYDRAGSLYATTVELQGMRGQEQLIKLFGMMQKNRQEIFESLKGGNKDFLYEAFNKALYDLELIKVKLQAYTPIAAEVLYEIDLYGRLKSLFFTPIAWLTGKYNNNEEESENPTKAPQIQEWLKNYKMQPATNPTINQTSRSQGILTRPAAPALAIDPKNPDILIAFQLYLTKLQDFQSLINADFDLLNPTDFSYHMSQLREGINTLGLWVLPALYGMLGAVIFHMRRLLDPNIPNPSGLRIAFRIVLGGFAGIILVLFWTPSSQKLTQPAYATLTSFGIAFLVGFSTDVFFQALDRLVDYLSQAVGKAGT